MALQRKASKGMQRVMESMTTARKRAPPQRKASKRGAAGGENQEDQAVNVYDHISGRFQLRHGDVRNITREVTETIKAHVDDGLANMLNCMQPVHQAAAPADPAPVASTSQQRTRKVANLSTSQLGNLSPAASASQLGNHEVVNQAVDIATSALVGNTRLHDMKRPFPGLIYQIT